MLFHLHIYFCHLYALFLNFISFFCCQVGSIHVCFVFVHFLFSFFLLRIICVRLQGQVHAPGGAAEVALGRVRVNIGQGRDRDHRGIPAIVVVIDGTIGESQMAAS